MNLYEGEVLEVLGKGYVVQPVPALEFYDWNSHYDDHLGACHSEKRIL